jgi:alpha-galactosidase
MTDPIFKKLPWRLVTLLLSATSLTTLSHAEPEKKPVKVYILSGQSNMVGIGQAGTTGRTAYQTYVSKETTEENQGTTLSIYQGAYDPSVDYDKAEAVETHVVRLGYWPHTSFPEVEGDQTQIARGYIKIGQPGRYTFNTTSSGSICEVDGKVVYNSINDKDADPEVVRYETGIYPIEVTFPGAGKSNLTYQFLDVPGSLHTVAKEQKKYPELVNEDGNWASRDDVWYKGVVTATADKWLSIGCGAGDGQVGPELGFGWVVGDHHEEPVLILKASEGNRSLAWDFLPPGSERYEVGDTVYAGYKDYMSNWEKGTEPKPPGHGWYAGKQYDDCFDAAKKALSNFDENFPHWKDRGYEINGFVWWQGHKDSGNEVHSANYEKNLTHLIKTLREDFKAPNAPFVVGTIGFGGWEMDGKYLEIVNSQLAVGDDEKHPEFADNVTTVETRDFWKSAEESPRSQDFHYNQNGETYYLVGRAFGKGMLELLEGDK